MTDLSRNVKPVQARPWLQLVRVPNLFTVPGDPIAGYLLASQMLTFPSGVRMFLAVGASFCFYTAGLMLNDLLDLEEDRRDRPKRPLPSGAVKAAHAWTATAFFSVGGLVLCALGGLLCFLIGGALVAAIAAYNGLTKRHPLIGPLNMGLCRGLSLLMGASFGLVIDNVALTAAVLMVLYIGSVTAVARTEIGPEKPSQPTWLPALAVGIGGTLFAWGVYRERWQFGAGQAVPLALCEQLLFCVCFAAALFVAIHAAITLNARPPRPVPPVIGSLIRGLIFLQAGFCAAAGAAWSGLWCALLLLALWPISLIVGKRFYAS